MEDILAKAKMMAGVRLSNRGESLYNQNLVDVQRIVDQEYIFNVKDVREDYQVQLQISDDLEYHCSCEYNSVTSAMCEHCIAALTFMNEHKDIVKIVDRNIQYLLDNYKNKLIVQAQMLLDDDKLQLEPIFEMKDDMMTLFFKVGYNKKYLIKDLHVFLDAIHSESIYALNGNEEIYLSVEKFNDASKRLIDMLRSRHILKENDGLQKKESNRRFMIKGRNLDAFFAYGYQYPVKLRQEEKKLIEMQFIPKPPEIKIWFEKYNHYYVLKHNIDFDVIERGNYGLYLLKDHIFYKGNVHFANMMEPLLQTLNHREELEIQEEMLYPFYNQVLKQVAQYVSFEGEILEQLQEMSVNLKLHLDINDQGIAFFQFFKEIDGIKYNLLQEDSMLNAEILAISDILNPYIAKKDAEYNYLADSNELFYEFVNDAIPLISSSVEIYVSDKVKAIKMKRLQHIGIGVSYDSGLLKFDFNFNDIDIDEMRQIIAYYREKRKFYRLKDGSFLDLKDNTLAEFVELIDDLGVEETKLNESLTLEAFRGLYLNRLMTDSSNLQFTKNKSYVDLVDEVQDIKQATFRVPSALDNILRDYQKEGFQWLKTMQKFHFGGILADDMGIGKTLQVLTLLSDLQKGPNLVICPSSIVFNWKNEITKFTPNLKCLVIIGNAQQRQDLILSIPDYDVVITSYDYLKRDISLYENLNFHYQILDEAQYIKNFNTKNALSTKLIQSEYRLALTGTPIENSLAELWSIMDFLMPNYLFSYQDFKESYEIPIVKDKNLDKQKRLANLIAPFVLRRMKKDVVKELPEKIESNVFIEFTETEKQLYTATALKMKETLTNDQNGNKMYILSMIMKLRQLCNEPRLLYENISNMSSKMETCLEIVEQSIATNKKILIFSQFTSVLDLVQQSLERKGIDYYYLSGDTPKLQRNQMANEFNEDDVPVFLISLKAGGTGLNLTGAEVVIHFDPWWNVAAQEQASDRAYRIGQKNVVQVFKLIMKDSIEEKILKMQELKKDIADAIIDEQAVNILKMSTEEILDLF